jgi:hypothetical protein
MAIAYGGTFTDGGLTTGTSLTPFAHDVGSGSDRLLVVGVLGDVGGGADDVSVTYNGVSMSLGVKNVNGSVNRLVYLFYLLNPDSGSHNVAVSAGSSHLLTGAAVHYTGVGSLDTTGTNQTSGSSITTTITTGEDNCWTVLVGGKSYDGQAPTAGSGTVLRGAADATFLTMGICDSNAAITPAGSTSLVFNHPNAGVLGTAMASFAPPSAGGSLGPRAMHAYRRRRA